MNWTNYINIEIHRNLLICPACNNDSLNELDNILKCVNCNREYVIRDNIPFNVNVLEVGCGTGQLANYLGLASRNVFGTDMCLNSLQLAENF